MWVYRSPAGQWGSSKLMVTKLVRPDKMKIPKKDQQILNSFLFKLMVSFSHPLHPPSGKALPQAMSTGACWQGLSGSLISFHVFSSLGAVNCSCHLRHTLKPHGCFTYSVIWLSEFCEIEERVQRDTYSATVRLPPRTRWGRLGQSNTVKRHLIGKLNTRSGNSINKN